MKKKPIYKYPEFITNITLEKTDTKRYWLKLVFDESKKESIGVVLKNHSERTRIYQIKQFIMSVVISTRIVKNIVF